MTIETRYFNNYKNPFFFTKKINNINSIKKEMYHKIEEAIFRYNMNRYSALTRKQYDPEYIRIAIDNYMSYIKDIDLIKEELINEYNNLNIDMIDINKDLYRENKINKMLNKKYKNINSEDSAAGQLLEDKELRYKEEYIHIANYTIGIFLLCIVLYNHKPT